MRNGERSDARPSMAYWLRDGKWQWKECSLGPLARKRRKKRMNGGDAKRACDKLYGPKWLWVERDQMASLIDGL